MKTNSASYRLAIQLLSSDPKNAQYPTTKAAALVSNAFRVGFDKIFRDVNRYIERAGSSQAPSDVDSEEFRQWWDREIGD